MPAIDSLLKRLGFVRLTRYGLVLTPEGRILSLRPEILDDGMGGKIVGWADHDLAGAELAKWEPARPAAQRAVATRAATVPTLHIPPLPFKIMPPPIPTVVIPPAAAAPFVEEDEWEWEIALARARAATEEAETAAKLAVAPPRRTRQDTVPPPVAAAQPVVKASAPKLEPATARVVTKPMPPIAKPALRPTFVPVETPTQPQAKFIAADTQPSAPPKFAEPRRTAQVAAVPPPVPHTHVRAPSPSTIIPVPKLPRVTETQLLQPVVAPRRIAKGTGPQTPSKVGIVPPPPIRPAEDDRTSPNLRLTAQAAAVARIPSIKRAAH